MRQHAKITAVTAVTTEEALPTPRTVRTLTPTFVNNGAGATHNICLAADILLIADSLLEYE